MDLDRIEALLKLMHEYRVSELGVEEDGASIHLALMHEGSQVTTSVPAAAPAAPALAATEASAADSNLVDVNSPMVGTFYRSPKPGTPSFVNVGDHVSLGQTLCIVEAMKLMNELESEVAGTIREIVIENAQPVQFGQTLFRIEPE
jgi:acetyl-CoA carboxylase biotin carboxyl carrier protein